MPRKKTRTKEPDGSEAFEKSSNEDILRAIEEFLGELVDTKA